MVVGGKGTQGSEGTETNESQTNNEWEIKSETEVRLLVARTHSHKHTHRSYCFLMQFKEVHSPVFGGMWPIHYYAEFLFPHSWLISWLFSFSLIWPLLLSQGSSCFCLKDLTGVFACFIPRTTNYACFPLLLIHFLKNTIALSFA